jgi:tyrosyl-tRNA synthetase
LKARLAAFVHFKLRALAAYLGFDPAGKSFHAGR